MTESTQTVMIRSLRPQRSWASIMSPVSLEYLTLMLSLTSIGDELHGLRTTLIQAGFPPCLWPYDLRCYSTLVNCRERADGKSPYKEGFEEDPDFLRVPLVAFVCFIPAPTKYVVSKAVPRLMPGVFMGYRMAPGGTFGVEDIVVDLDDFKGISLGMMTRHTKFRFQERFVQSVVLPDETQGTTF